MHSPTQSSMPAHSIAAATAVLTFVALGCILALSVLSEGDHDQRLRPISLPRTFRGTKSIDQVRQLRPVAFMRNIAHGRRLANDEDSGIPDNYGNKQGHQKPALSLALVRPISVRDAYALVNSFLYWDEFAPSTNKGCRFGRGTQSASIDIIISFSREFDEQKYPDISEAMGTVHSLFEKTNGWGGCIQSVNMFEANIRPEEDLYDPLLAEQGNRMWANGPNRQFERTFRYVQSLDKYDAMFLMESDTYPAADGWLDLLIEEVKSSAPFALLGSKYNGHAWDDFAGQMPLALLHHINGNAIYNTTHPLFEHIVSELEDEADTWYNAITYDYRISQILLEGSTGAPPEFPNVNTVDENGKRMKLQPKTEKFSRWWKEYPDTYELVQESNVMTNLGSTAFLPGDVEDGIALVHGKNMYLPWDSSIHGSVSLVVSDWGELGEPYKEFLSKLNAVDHPYSEIILVANLESEEIIHKVSDWCDSAIDLPIVIQNRTDDRSMDLCNTQSTTDYFMLTDVGHAPREKIELMVAPGRSTRPVIPFVSSQSVHCSSYKSCNTVIQEARHFYDGMDRFVFSGEMLFRRDFLQEYCDELRGQENPTIISNGNTDNRLVAPSATGYIAFLHMIEVVDSHYAFSNIAVEGSRRNFVLADPRIPIGLKYHAAEIENRSGIDTELPVLWHIPKSGGTTIMTLLSRCLRKTVASSSGVVLERRRGILGATELPTSLHVVQKAESEVYASVDVSSPEGIERARNLDLLGSDLADVIITPLLAKAASDLYSSETGRRARIFSVFRHPVERAVSLFYYLQSATWEPTYDPTLQSMTLAEYASSEKAESNWMVRMLNNDPVFVDERHLNIAKRILREKVLIGLTSQMEDSIRRFYSYFGWGGSRDKWSQCERRLLFEGANTNDRHSLEEGAMAWDLLSSRNSLDVALYDYAVELFHNQGAILFESNSFSPAGSFAPGLTGNSDVVDDEIQQLLDMNAGRQLESNVADGDIVSLRTPFLVLSCSEMIDSNACAGRQNCVWKESSKICESNVFGHSAKVEYKSHSRKECMLLQTKRNVLRCLKRKKRLCRAIEHRDRKLKCRNKQRKKIRKIRKALNSRALSQSASFQSRPLHILSLGGSVTWGSQLDDRSLAYPALLSKLLPGTSFTTNIAMRATGSDYASMCLQSMIIDGQTGQDFYFETQESDINYDIITIEYSLNGVEALPRLLQRLRVRYPDATIIYINLYSWAQGVIESTSQKRIYEIKARTMKEDSPEKMAQWIAGLKQNYHRQLTFRGHLSAAEFSLIEGSIQRYKGIMYNWPVPTNPIDDIVWFASDLYHLNAAGHRRVAEDVAKIIAGKAKNRAKWSFGSWGASNEDQCTSWYSSGIATQIELNKNITLFSPRKYAVEATKDSEPLKIVFVSRFNKTVPVALSIMAHKSVYPKAIVGVHKRLEKIQADHLYELDPTNRIVAARVNHVVQTHFVGYARPGRNIISVVTLEESDWPLRVTGILMCDECDLEQGNGGELAVPQGDNTKLAIARLTEKPKVTSFDNRPSMYTFYSHVETGASVDTDRKLLELWAEEWTIAGFDAKILTLDDARKHPSFPTYERVLREQTKLYKPLEYNYMCFFRWLAMAAIGGGYMSDNDVLPMQGSYMLSKHATLPNDGNFTAYQRHVPSMMSGSANEWDRLASTILATAIAQSNGHMKIDGGSRLTSDMMALLSVIKTGGDVIVHPDHILSNPQDFLAMNQSLCMGMGQKPAVHFSHHAIHAMGSEHVDLRPAIMRKWMTRWRTICGRDESQSEMIEEPFVNESLSQIQRGYLGDSTMTIMEEERVDELSPSERNFMSLIPKLGFTNSSMFWEDTHGHDSPSISLVLRGERELSWKPPSTDGNFPGSFRTREDISFQISRYRNKVGLPPACDSDRSGGVLVWIESINNDVVLTAPALCVHSGDDLLARAQIQDPGRYRIHVVGYDLGVLEAGAHGTVATILPARNSPWYFLVKPEAVAIPSPTSAPPAFNLPLRFCEFSYLEESGEGRWLECAAAGIPQSRCLSDGWIYVPHECNHRITPTVDALEQAKEIADKRGGKALWIVFTGTSVDRGTFHALVDHVAAIGMMEDGAIKRSVADAIFRNVEDQRGQGSTTKCWGWIDIQVGSLRLSYQDARLHLMRDDQHWIAKTNERWKELLSEGPDLMVLGLEGHSNTPDDLRTYDLVTSQIVEAAAATNFTGLVAINPTKKRILNGGIKNAYECSSGDIRSSIENVRFSLSKAFSRCKRCIDLDKNRFVVSDELLMGWSFLFNMERPMSDEIASQHFHRYVSDALPQPSCGSKHTNRRYVIGAVTEMSAHIYLGTVLSRLNKDLGISIQDESLDVCNQITTTEEWEVSFAKNHPFRACFTCPYSALPWKPPTSPISTLSDEILANTMDTFDASRFNFAPSASRGREVESLAFCYE